MKRQWHLDCAFKKELFSDNWNADSHEALLSIFRYLDDSEKEVLSTLPPGIDPAGAAIAAAMYFLPGAGKPPNAHCRIAVYPGFHFLRYLKKARFDPSNLFEATQTARVMRRGSAVLSQPLTILNEKLRKATGDLRSVHFHWIWKCRRLWARYNQIESADILPRSSFSRGDSNESVIDLIETDNIQKLKGKVPKYDLLIYSPYFHSRSFDKDEDEIKRVLNTLNSFEADRKLVIARSPYDYWSKQLESALGMSGILIQVSSSSIFEADRDAIKFLVVDQLIDTGEAVELYTEIKKQQRSLRQRDSNLLSELRGVLRNLLIKVDPTKDHELLQESLIKLESIAVLAGFARGDGPGKIIWKIIDRAKVGGFKTKRDVLFSLSPGPETEIWVTKDSDKQLLADLRSAKELYFSIRLANRWSPPGARMEDAKVIVTRLDRESDLDLVAYLRSGDVVIMSAWEAVIRQDQIEEAWERSQKWRDKARQPTNEAVKGIQTIDPVLELADFLGNHVKRYSATPPNVESQILHIENSSWWDDFEYMPTTMTEQMFNEHAFTKQNPGVLCFEIFLDGGLSVFLRQNGDVQVLKSGDEDEDEFESVRVTELQSEDTILLFKDSERNSIFDILFEQLERSNEFGEDAETVRKWKSELRDGFIKAKIVISEVREILEEKGRSVDLLTVRSWILGPTMAPRRYEDMILLVQSLQIEGVNTTKIYASVRKLRSIARILGRTLNKLILTRDLEGLDKDVRDSIDSAGIDLEELLSTVMAVPVMRVGTTPIEIAPSYVGKIFKRGKANST